MEVCVCVYVLYVWMGGGPLCTNQAFYGSKSKPKQRQNNTNIRAATAGSTAICQILMSAVHAVEEPRDK